MNVGLLPGLTDFRSAARAVLEQMRTQLGLDAAYVSRMDDVWFRLLEVDCVDDLLSPDMLVPSEATICWKALSGEGPAFVTDVDTVRSTVPSSTPPGCRPAPP